MLLMYRHHNGYYEAGLIDIVISMVTMGGAYSNHRRNRNYGAGHRQLKSNYKAGQLSLHHSNSNNRHRHNNSHHGAGFVYVSSSQCYLKGGGGPEVYRQHNSNYWTGLIGSVITMVTKGQGYQVIVIMIVVMKQGHKISTTKSNYGVCLLVVAISL